MTLGINSVCILWAIYWKWNTIQEGRSESKIKCRVSFSEFGDICKTKNKSCYMSALLVWFLPIYLNCNSTICYSLAVTVPANHVIIKTVLTVSLLKAYRYFKRGHVFKRNCGTQVSFFLLNPRHWVSYVPLCSHHVVPPSTQAHNAMGNQLCTKISKLVSQNHPFLFRVGSCYSDYINYFPQCCNKMKQRQLKEGLWYSHHGKKAWDS